MTDPTGPSSAPRRRPRWWVVFVAVVVAGLALALVTGPPGAEGPPLDPRSTDPHGAKALVDVLREVGATVTVGAAAPDARHRTALLLVDRGSDATREAIRDWVRDGGTLVVADARSPLAPADIVSVATFDLLGGIAFEPRCDLPVVDGVGRVRAPAWTELVPRSDGAATCFPVDDGAGMVVTRQGRGEVVVLGMPGMATNAALDEEDNAQLLVALLAPEVGTTVHVLHPPAPGAGDRSLAQLVPGRVWSALAQLVLGFAVYAWWRARRLGAPVEEPLPAPIAGSELVVAVGNLLQRTRNREAAVAALRDQLRRDLAERFGMPSGADVADVVEVVSSRTSLDVALLRTALTAPAPRTDEELLALASTIEIVRAQATRGARAGAGARSDPGGRP